MLMDDIHDKLIPIIFDKIDAAGLVFYIKHQKYLDVISNMLSSVQPNQIILTRQQLDLLSILNKTNQVLVPKGRQVGTTTAISIYLALEAYFSNKKIIIIGPNLHCSRNILDRVRKVLDILKYVANNKEKYHTNSVGRIKLNAEQFIDAISSHPIGGKSRACDIIYIDEAAFFSSRHMDELFQSVICQLQSGGQFIMSSSTNGQDSFFYPKVVAAKNNENSFTVFEMFDNIDIRVF